MLEFIGTVQMFVLYECLFCVNVYFVRMFVLANLHTFGDSGMNPPVRNHPYQSERPL